MTWQHVLIGLSVLAAAALYVWKGEPGRADEPFAQRAEEIAAKDVSELSAPEMLTRLQQLSQQYPDDPTPQHHIGIILKAQGRDREALRAFQSALKRNDRYVPSLVAFGDILVRSGQGEIELSAEQAYLRAWQLDPNQVRPGILAGLAAAEAGRTEEADAIWRQIEAGLAPDDPKRAMFDTIIGSYAQTDKSSD